MANRVDGNEDVRDPGQVVQPAEGHARDADFVLRVIPGGALRQPLESVLQLVQHRLLARARKQQREQDATEHRAQFHAWHPFHFAGGSTYFSIATASST